MLSISSNAPQVAALLESAVAALPKGARAARDAVAEKGFEHSKENLQEIYAQADTEDYINGDFLGHYLDGGDYKRTGALKAAETLLISDERALITTAPGAITGPAGTKRPELYAEKRAHNSRPAGAYWRERAAEETEHEASGIAETALLEAMPQGLVTK